MKRRIIILSLCFWSLCSCIAMAMGTHLPLHDSLGAGGLADLFNKMTFEKKRVYITSCNKLPDFSGEEIYMFETNVGALGDNVIMIYPNAEGLINKILIMARKDSRIGSKKMFDAVVEECIVIFNSALIDRKNERELQEMIDAVLESLKKGKSSFWSTGTGRRYLIDAFEQKSNNIIYGNVRITAQD